MVHGLETGCRDLEATCFTEVFQYSWLSEKPFEDVWREWVKKVSKLPQGSLSSRVIEQLTMSGLSRHGKAELENHLRFRAPMAWQHIQSQGEKISLHNLSSTVTTTNGHQRSVDRCKVPKLWKPDTSKERVLVQWQTDGDSPIQSIATGLHERSRRGSLDGLRSFIEIDNHCALDVGHLRKGSNLFMYTDIPLIKTCLCTYKLSAQITHTCMHTSREHPWLKHNKVSQKSFVIHVSCLVLCRTRHRLPAQAHSHLPHLSSNHSVTLNQVH